MNDSNKNMEQIKQRRLSIDSEGNVKGHTFNQLQAIKPMINNHELKVPDLSGYFNPLTVSPSQINNYLFDAIKKINEYEKMLIVITDPVIKGFIELMLKNIKTELTRITAEVSKMPNQFNFQAPLITNNPPGPFIAYCSNEQADPTNGYKGA